jgi:alpha-tubulin suppressor-like RCC1 family protein
MTTGLITRGRSRARRWITRGVLAAAMAGLGSAVITSPALAAAQGTTTIAGGGYDTCSIQAGKAWCWGYNQYGELGNGSTTSSSVPVPVYTGSTLAGKTITRISASFGDTCALDATGNAYCWGYNGFGQLGDNVTKSTSSSRYPVPVYPGGALAGKKLIQISVGGYFACALDSAGKAYCWGFNFAGELGNGTTANSSVPVPVASTGVLAGKTLTQISLGLNQACALDTAGKAYCWGWVQYGGLGNGSTGASAVPVAVDTSGVLAGKKLTQISASQGGTCAIDTVGRAYCWGVGPLGNGSTSGSLVPVAVDTSGVLAGKTLTQISLGDGQACALDDTGAAYCWGSNRAGQLGDGTTTDSTTPVAVITAGALADRTLTQISGGGFHTCAVDSVGAAYCWGDNEAGALGDDTTIQSTTPVLAGPAAPAGVTVMPGDTTATVTWIAPASLDGGSVTGYTATAEPGGRTCGRQHATKCTIKGLANGTRYTISVVARTSVGRSGASAPATVTPAG